MTPSRRCISITKRNASSSIQTSKFYGGSDEAIASTNQSETRRVILGVSDDDYQYEVGDELTTYSVGWKLAAIMFSLSLACIQVTFVYLQSPSTS